ncbi:MAG TPA: hypothetical protein VGP68_24820 [Gemmataceae bacterium]|jgi:hypothetical protein|nr:hypothetical protein [Gemmataceae bacterium]
MLARYLLGLTLMGLILCPAPARTADEKTTQPTIQIRLKSLDRTLDDLKFFLASVGQEGAFMQLDEARKGPLAGAFDAIDAKKPWALYGHVKADLMESAGVLLVPVTSEKAFLSLLENVAHLKPTKDGDYYMVQPDNVPLNQPIYFRFAEGYACAAVGNKDALKKGSLILPSAIFAKPISGSLDMHFRVDLVPNEYKQMLLGTAEVQLAEAQEKPLPGENEAQRRGRIMGMKAFGQMFSAMMKDGTDISLDVDISREHDHFGFGMGFGAKPGSDLAKKIATLTAGKSLFAGWINPASPASFVSHAPLGEDGQKMVELMFTEGLANLAKQGAHEKTISEKVKKALEPTIKAKSVDVGLDWRGPSASGHYTLVAGVKVVDGDKVESLVKELLNEAPEKERAMIKLDASSIGEYKVHRLDVASTFDANARKILGDNPIYFSFRKDAVFLVLGDNGLAALGEAIQGSPAAAPLVRGTLNLKGLVPLMKQSDPRAEGLAKDAFSKAGDDAITFTVQGGDSLQMRLEAKGPVIKFMAGMGNKK